MIPCLSLRCCYQVSEPFFFNSFLFNLRAVPSGKASYTMKLILLILVCGVTAISGSQIMRQLYSPDQVGSAVTFSCNADTQTLLDPEYEYSLSTADYQVHDNICFANVSEPYEASTTCLASNYISCGFQQIPFNSLKSRCCEKRCQMFSYVIRRCSTCPLIYVRTGHK